MPENHEPPWVCEPGYDKRTSDVVPDLIDDPGAMLAPEVKDKPLQNESHDNEEENPFWRDKAEIILAKLAELAGSREPEAMLQALNTLPALKPNGETP
jgi:hypothetical protein